MLSGFLSMPAIHRNSENNKTTLDFAVRPREGNRSIPPHKHPGRLTAQNRSGRRSSGRSIRCWSSTGAITYLMIGGWPNIPLLPAIRFVNISMPMPHRWTNSPGLPCFFYSRLKPIGWTPRQCHDCNDISLSRCVSFVIRSLHTQFTRTYSTITN